MFRKPYHNKLHPPPTSIGGGVLASAAIKKSILCFENAFFIVSLQVRFHLINQINQEE